MTRYDLLDLIWYACSAVILVPIALGVRYWAYLSVQERTVVWFLVIMLALEIIATCLRYSLIRNHFIFYFRTLAVLWVGVAWYEPQINWKRWPALLAVIVVGGMLAEVWFWVGFNYINTFSLTLAWLLLVSYGFLSLLQLMNLPTAVSLRQKPDLYMNAGFVLLGFFSAGTACLENYFIETSLDLYYFSDTLLVFMSATAYVSFATGFARKQQISDSLLSV